MILQAESRWRLVAWPICMTMLASFLSGLAGLGFGREGIEKLLSALVMPVGLLWLVVTSWMIISWFQRRNDQRWWATVAWTVVTLLSTGPVPNLWINHLESQIAPYRPDQQPPLDCVVVLGGGTTTGPTRSQAGANGDRVVYAAQLYLQGHCQNLITTGTSAAQIGKPVKAGPTEQTIEIWTELGIPATAISALPGRNTFEEMQSLKGFLPNLQGKRVGLLTSASHLPRALRLAEAAGISGLIPIPANLNDDGYWRTLGFYLPSSQHLNKFATCQHEWMGSLIGR